ncbi:hypothetical protein G6F43_006404 [Rhizopus delemar]|nr:hypothetical protein G6F43_006404 [Rhizopus delemar]
MYPSYTKLDTNNTSKTNNHQLVTDHSSYYQAKYMTKDKMIIPSKGQLSWQQSIFLQKKPEQPIAITYSQNQYTPSVQSTPISAIVSKEAIEEVNRQTKKRYMTREQDPISPIASSMSEPIRTNIDHPPVPRKRTKSLQYDRSMTSSPFSSSDGSSNDNNDHHQLVEPANYVTLSNALDSFSDSFYDGVQSHQMLLAMPRRQKLRYEGDHYTPKWVRYTGHLKEGYCDICPSGKWLQLKNSAYWYHKQFYHGISSVTGKPFMKPVDQRLGKGDITEGLCHQCQKFVPVCNSKKKNNYMLWYRHAHKCHLYDKHKLPVKTTNRASSH